MIYFRNYTRTKISKFFFKILTVETEIKLNKKINDFSLNLVGTGKIKWINEQYRHRKGQTDTISFVFSETQKFPDEIMGEIFICPIIIKKNAIKNKVSFNHELARVFVHSLLHLLGFTHESESKLEKMQILTEKIIAK